MPVLVATLLPGGSVVKNPPVGAGDMGSIPGLGRSPGGGYATHSGILAWQILWTEEPEGLQSMPKELDMTEHTCRVTTLGLLAQSTMDFWIHMLKAGLNKYIYLSMLCKCLFLSKPTLHNIVVQM